MHNRREFVSVVVFVFLSCFYLLQPCNTLHEFICRFAFCRSGRIESRWDPRTVASFSGLYRGRVLSLWEVRRSSERKASGPQPEPSPAPELPAFPEAAAPPGAVPLCCPGTAAPLLLRSTHGGLHSRSGRGSLTCGGQPALGGGLELGGPFRAKAFYHLIIFLHLPPLTGQIPSSLPTPPTHPELLGGHFSQSQNGGSLSESAIYHHRQLKTHRLLNQ